MRTEEGGAGVLARCPAGPTREAGPVARRAMVSALVGPADFMLEAKEKDRALFALRQLGVKRQPARGQGATAP